MADSNVKNSNRVQAGGVQGANIVNSQIHNPIINFHTPGGTFSQNYQRIGIIGRGAFGDAWKIKPKHVSGSDEFVMKEIRCCEQDVDAGRQEIEILKQCSHENIVQYIEHFFEEGKFLIVMEFCRGGDLMELIEKQKKTKKQFPESTVKEFFFQMTKGTAYIHNNKIPHRDLKPSNIFVSSDQVLKLGNFGISKKHNSTMSMANTLVGTNNYIAPEIYGNMPYNEKADIWALACILYELAALQPAFSGHTFLPSIMQGLYDKEPLEQQYSSSVSALVGRLLTTDPERRPSAREVLEIININFLDPDTLHVTSSGLSAEYQGDRLGVYKKAGTYRGCPYYKQEDTQRSDGKENVMYRSKKEGWVIGPCLGGSVGLKHWSKTAECVPLTGWSWWGGSYFVDDPDLRISPDQPPACGEITISASGDAAVMQPECIGVYTPTQMFSAGRQVFQHQTQERYLLVRPGYRQWSVQHGVKSKEARMASPWARMPSMCPADPRVRTIENRGQTSWLYYKPDVFFPWGDLKYGDITVKCSVHKC